MNARTDVSPLSHEEQARNGRRSPRVTVISAYYKRPDAVRVTLESLVSQDWVDWRALIWDDASPDSTWRELQAIQGELSDPRIEVFRHEPNVGFVRGMNFAMQQTDSEYVAVIGSGDSMARARLARQVAALDADPAASFCTTDAVSIVPDTGARFVDNTFSRSRIEAADLLVSCPFTHGSVMFRRAAVEAAGYYEPTFVWSSDWDLFNRLLATSHAIHIPEPLYERYAREEGASFAPSKALLQIKYAHLAHALRQDPGGRVAILERVRREGLDAVLSDRRSQIGADLRSRQAKLYILGRKELADELGALLAVDYPANAKWRATIGVLRSLSGLPLVRLYGLAHSTNQLRKRLRRGP